MQLPTLEHVKTAQQYLKPFVAPTPLLFSPLFEQKYGIKLYVKADSLTAIGAFKIRGAIYAVGQLSEAERSNGVVAFSTGNHAQAVAYAAAQMGIESVIIMPNTAPAVKIENTKAFGAKVVLFDPKTESRHEIADTYVVDKNMAFIHPFDNFNVIAGQGVSGLETCQQMQAQDIIPDAAILPISGGGYIAGFGLAFTHYHPDAQLIGVEPHATGSWAKSLQLGERTGVEPNGSSICDAIMPPNPQPGELNWAVVKDKVSSMLAVSDEDALTGMACAQKYFGLTCEPSGAASIGALIKHKVEWQGKTVVAAISGRNVDEKILNQAADYMAKV